MSKQRSFYHNEPRIIKAKFDCYCAETGQKIPKGVNCLYYPIGKVVYILGSNEYDRWAMRKQDEQFNNQSL